MSSGHGVGGEQEAEAIIVPPRVETYPTSTDTHTTTMSTTTAIVTNTTRTAATTEAFFSPLKRKRDRSPFEIPETPWRLQSAPAEEEDEERSEVVEVEVDDVEAPESSGQISPRSRKLASQLEDLSLATTGPLFTLMQQGGGDLEMEEEGPAAKKPKRKVRATTTTTTMMALDGMKRKKVGIEETGVHENGDAPMDGDGNFNGDTEVEATTKRKGGGRGVEWEDEPLTGSLGEEEEMGDNTTATTATATTTTTTTTTTIANMTTTTINTNTNTNTKRARLRSPPLSRTKDIDIGEDDGVAVVDESEDVDSDDPEQSGIGYRPTPTQRYVRSQKRMQQIKEYKARISKEAREKRSESRRRRRSFPDRYAVAAGSGAPNDGSDEGARKKTVQFKIDPVVS